MKFASGLISAAVCALPLTTSAQVVINEFMYDDSGTDDREFVELYNAGANAVDLSGWTLGGYDATTNNQSTTLVLPASIPPGGFFVIANPGTLNVNHIVPGGFLENDNEAIVLRDAAGTLVDAVACETNKGVGFLLTGATAPADAAAVAAQIGPGIFGNHQGVDIAGSPLFLNATVSMGRFVDGRDTNNNGRDFGLRPSTPGTTNAPGGTMTSFVLPDPTPGAPGTVLGSMAGSFAPVLAIDPTVVDSINPNAISPPFGAGSKAWISWDTAGGGNGNASLAIFPYKTAGFAVRAWLETTDMPVQSNAAGTQFRGSEITLYGLGGGDALTNLTDLDGSVGLSAAVLPLSESGNGFTGIAWVYERVAADPATLAVSEKLHLVDANDGGDSDTGGNTPLDWTILATIDLGTTAPGWHNLSINVDAAGHGVAAFDGQRTNFTAPDMHSSAFNIGYRENLQLGADGTPDAFLRPPTFTFMPALGLLAFAPPTPGATNLTIPVAPGQTIGIEYSQSLLPESWIDIGNVSAAGGAGTFSDTDPVRVVRPRGFYRGFLR